MAAAGTKKHAALADITNTGRPGARGAQQKPHPPPPPAAAACGRSMDLAEILQENAVLRQLLGERTKIVELSAFELQKLRFALRKAQQQNLQLAQTNSQMLMELNVSKDRLKILQHELKCAEAVLRLKTPVLEEKNEHGKALPKGASFEAVSSEVAEARDHPVDKEASNVKQKCSAETQSFVQSTMSHQEVPQGQANKRKSVRRSTNKRKSGSCEDREDPEMEISGKPLQQDRRGPVRRSSRLNPASCELREEHLKTEEHNKISDCSLVTEPVYEDAISAPLGSNISIEPAKNTKQSELIEEPFREKNKISSCSLVMEPVHEDAISAPPVSNISIEQGNNGKQSEPMEEPHKNEENKIPACSRGINPPPEDSIPAPSKNASNTNRKHSAETKPFVPSTMNHQEVPQAQGQANKRKSMRIGANRQKPESCEWRNDPKMEFAGEALQEDRRKPAKRRSSRLNPASCELREESFNTEENSKISDCSLLFVPGREEAISAPPVSDVSIEQAKSSKQSESIEEAFKTGESEKISARSRDIKPVREDAISAPPSPNISIEQAKNGKQSDHHRSSSKPADHEQAERRKSSVRPSRRATEKVVSYREIPLNVKMRRVG